MFLTSANFLNFGVSVLANLFTSASFILAGKWKGRRVHSIAPAEAEPTLPILLAPHLEKLAHCVTSRGGIERIELTAEENEAGSHLHFHVERGSRDQIMDFIETAPASDFCLAGEIRSVDLDRQRATMVEAATGNRKDLEFSGDPEQLMNAVGRIVEVGGKSRLRVDRRGRAINLVEVETITPLDPLTR